MTDIATHDHIDYVACRKLWLNVLLAVLLDYRQELDAAKDEKRPRAIAIIRKRAERYVRSEDCRLVAMNAGFEIPPDAVMRWIEGEGPPGGWRVRGSAGMRGKGLLRD